MPKVPDSGEAHPRETYLQALFENLEVGVLIADDAAVYVDANPAACRLFGCTREGIVGHHLSEFIEGARAPEVDVQWQAFLRDGKQSGLSDIKAPDGSVRTIAFQAQANFVRGLHCSLITEALPIADSDQANFVTVCAWTKRIQAGENWLSLEHYLLQEHGLWVTHGICPDAFSSESAKNSQTGDALA